MAIPATQITYPLTTLACNDLTTDPTRPFQAAMGSVGFTAAGTTAELVSLFSSMTYNELTTPKAIPAQIQDTTASLGTAGQVLTAGVAGSSVVWADAGAGPTPSLASVAAVATAGDFGAQALSNAPSLSMTADAGVSAVVLSAIAASDVLNLSTAADVSGDTKDFSRSYLPISVAGVVYYLPLFSVPV